MFVLFDNTYYLNYTLSTTVPPLDYVGDVVIAMDPSKTNFAMVVGTPNKQVLQIVEFSGNNRKKGPAEDTTVYCAELKQFLSQYLSKVHLYIAGIEAAITPHSKGKNNYAFHISNMVLTEIRADILATFMQLFGIHILEINNWSWKHRELPEGYRGQQGKYSKKYLQDYYPDNSLCDYYEADACDAYFIYCYIIDTMCENYTLICTQAEDPLREFEVALVEEDSILITDLTEVPFNNVFTVEDNINFYGNRMSNGCYFKVNIDCLDLDMIYNNSHCDGSSILEAEEALVIVL